MINYLLIQSGLLVLLSFCLVDQYSEKNVKLYQKLLVSFTYFCCFSVAIFLPYDIYMTIHGKQEDKQLVNSIWTFIYWSNVIQCWIVLPFLSKYESSGYLSRVKKLMDSLKQNLKIYLYLIVIGITLHSTLYLFKQIDSFGVGYIKKLVNFIGLILTIILLGYGLIVIPRNWWRSANHLKKIQYFQQQTVRIKHQLDTYNYQLTQLINSLIQDHQSQFYSQLEYEKNDFEDVLKQVPQSFLNLECIQDEEKQMNLQIEDYNKLIKQKLLQIQRCKSEFNQIVRIVCFLEDIQEQKRLKIYKIRSTVWLKKQLTFNDQLAFLWYSTIEKYLKYSISITLSIFSILIVVLENICYSNYQYQILSKEDSFFKIQLICILILSYMSVCMYYGFFNIRIMGIGDLYKGETDASALLDSANNISIVSSPLAYNFLKMMRIENTSFQLKNGGLDIQATVGSYFQQIIPLFLIVLCLITILDYNESIFAKYSLYNKYEKDECEKGKQIIFKGFEIQLRTNLERDEECKLLVHQKSDLQQVEFQSQDL